MSNKFFFLYLIGGIIAVILLVCDVVTAYPSVVSTSKIIAYVIPSIALFYLAFKTRREKEDHDMM